jgi:hypothetical protein
MIKAVREATRQFPTPDLRVGIAGFLLMIGVGSMYGMSALLVELPRLLGVPVAWSLAPFGAACLGLAAGTAVGARRLHSLGGRLAAILGTSVWGIGMAIAGLALSGGNLPGVIVGFGIGGAGVGLAYLTIVTTVGPSFPTHPLVGSAIGPLGFMTGTGLFFIAALTRGFHHLSGSEIGVFLISAGLIVSTLAFIAGRGMPPASRTASAAIEAEEPSAAPARRVLSWLLFANALPGMLLLAVVVPVMGSYAGQSDTDAAEVLIVATIVLLFLGGLLAPGLRKRMGSRKVFLVLLIVRGLLLVTLPFVPWSAAGVLLLAAVLFGHGAGFSLLPGLMKAQDKPQRFPINYGLVLVAWGLAGVVGVAAAALSVTATGSYGLALFLAGGVALSAAVLLTLSGNRHPALAD